VFTVSVAEASSLDAVFHQKSGTRKHNPVRSYSENALISPHRVALS
jgi:hypothetical protein